MALPRPERVEEYARKGVELLLRQLGIAPEQRAARHLSARSGSSTNGRRVLIVTPRDWAAHVQYEAVIGQALRARGATVEFLTCGGGLAVCDRANTYEAPPMPCRSCTQYVHTSIDAHGFDRTSIRDGWERDDPGRWPELDEIAAEDLTNVTGEGVALGETVDIPLKWFLCAADLSAEPRAALLAREFLRSGRRIARGVSEALAAFKPDVVLLLNGLFLFESIAWALCRNQGIDVVTYERAFRQGTLVFSRDVPAGFYDFARLWAQHDRPLGPDEEAELDDYLGRRRRGAAFDQFWSFEERDAGADRTGRLVTAFTNLTWDTAVIGRDTGFTDIRVWLASLIAYFEARPDDRLIIRIHPSETFLPGKRTRDSLEEYVHARYDPLPSNVEVVGAADVRSSYELMDASDVGVVYTSTTGLELALSGKPVVVCGEVHYRGKGFTIDVDDPAGLWATIDEVLADPEAYAPAVSMARRYAHFFFFRAPVDAPYVVEPLTGLARLTLTSIDDLRPGIHAGLDAICDGILGGRPVYGRP